MTIANIDTFEHDISDEIKNKEATMGDIASAAGSIENSPQINTISPVFLVIVITLCLSGIIAGGMFGYLYYTKKQSATMQPKVTPLGASFPTVSLNSISLTLDQEIGRFISSVQRSDYGYSLAINTYSPVYSYLIKNERSYVDELAIAVGSARDTSTTTPSFTFTDLTINNQNIRVGTSGSSTVMYAFVNNPQTLLIASTTEAILSLRSAILH